MKRSTPLQSSAFKTRSQKLAAAGFARRPSGKMAGGLWPDPEEPREDRFPGVDIDAIHRGRYGSNAVNAPQPKDAPARSEPYRRLVASLPCALCGIHGRSQAAHGDEGKGLQLKSSDTTCYPACGPHDGRPGCHYLIGSTGTYTRTERRAMEASFARQTWAALLKLGRHDAKVLKVLMDLDKQSTGELIT